MLAIADGAGSALHGAQGAAAAVDAARESVRRTAASPRRQRLATADVLRLAFRAARRRVFATATELDVEPRDVATTLACVVVRAGALAAAQVGDGIVVVDHDGEIRAITEPSHGEYANETVFVTSAGALADLAVDVLPADEVHAVALSTDGLQLVALDDRRAGTPFVPFFEDAFVWLTSGGADDAGVASFLAAVDDRTGDDKTLLLGRPADAHVPAA